MRRRAVTHLAGDGSPLRRARLARNWTLEDVVAQMDARAASGDSGVTASMVSGWERGRHTTSIAHRKTLCAVYGQAPEVLFADQDEMPNVRVAPRLLATSAELHKEMLATVVGARRRRSPMAGCTVGAPPIPRRAPRSSLTSPCGCRPGPASYGAPSSCCST